MNILMMTNTYKPLLGGLEKSVEAFSNEFRSRGHHVVIVAPEFEGMKPEEHVVRIPALKKFNGTDFSVQLPIPGNLNEALGNFKPDIVHSHHPFLVGDTALRVATAFNAPLVFTHHTLYEENVHYLPGNEHALKKFVIELSTGYANLADQIFAPSDSVMQMIKERGVKTPVAVIPTGIDVEYFSKGDGNVLRKKLKISPSAFVIGHIGRLAPEKNLEFVTKAVVNFLKANPKSHFVIGGKGPSEEAIQQICDQEGVADRLHFAGVVKGQDLVDCYHAMDVFVFASQSETQGLVVTEAMAAGVPVVAVDAPGVREVVKDKINGRLLMKEDLEEFVAALGWMNKLTAAKMKKIKKACGETAELFSMKLQAEKVLAVYVSLLIKGFVRRPYEEIPWDKTIRMIQAQWGLMLNLTKAAGAMIVAGVGAGEKKDGLPELELQFQ